MTTTIAKWEKQISRTKKLLPPLPNPHGKHIPCIYGCGRFVGDTVLVCRSCRRSAKIKKERANEKVRKHKG
jgi:hypothetical protein